MHHISNLYLPCRGRTEPFSQLTINAARAIRLSRPGKGADSGELTEQFRTRRRANEAFWIFLGYKTCSQRPFAKTRMLHQGREEIDIMSRRSEEHTSELQSLMRTSYAVFCLKKKKKRKNKIINLTHTTKK